MKRPLSTPVEKRTDEMLCLCPLNRECTAMGARLGTVSSGGELELEDDPSGAVAVALDAMDAQRASAEV
jgi:hypothetical protein